jgi:hypothetical protein
MCDSRSQITLNHYQNKTPATFYYQFSPVNVQINQSSDESRLRHHSELNSLTFPVEVIFGSLFVNVDYWSFMMQNKMM